MKDTISPASTFDILGLNIAITDLNKATAQIIDWKQDTKGRFICVRDVHGVMLARRSKKLRDIHENAAMITPDGMPLVFLGRRMGHDVGRACGADLMDSIIARGRSQNLGHYFFGGDVGVAQKLASHFGNKFPKMIISGHESPPYRDFTQAEIAAMIARIKVSGADIVWVGMSTPKQEIWMNAVFERLPVTLIGVGAAFDFHTGKIKRAPRWMQGSGLEWLHRLLSEPRRLWRRYLVLAPKFVLAVLGQKIRDRKI